MTITPEAIIRFIELILVPIFLYMLYKKIDKRDKVSDRRYDDRGKQDILMLENLNANGKLAKVTAKLLVKLVRQEKPNGEANELEDYIKHQTDVSNELDDHIRTISQRRR